MSDTPVDIRREPSVTITDTYTKTGRHLKSVCTTEDGRIIWEEGRSPSKDVWFMPHIDWPWKKESE